MRPDALPASAEELLSKRSSGWLLRYSLGNQTPQEGVPLVNALRWDTGVQAHATIGMLSATAAVTAGTVSNPLFSDDNDGRQLAGRVELKPVPGLVLGSSLARGQFVGQDAARAAGSDGRDGDFTQTAWGADAEYSRDHYLARVEAIVSRWRVPVAAAPLGRTALQTPLDARSLSVEGRYKLRPDLYVAARVGHLGFSDQIGATGALPWDAPVTRVEVGGGYSIQRNLVLKASVQHDNRDGGRLLRVANFFAAQLVYWF